MLALIRGNGKPNRTEINAINSLTNTLKTTPFGEPLGFGKIIKEGRKSIVVKSVEWEQFSLLAYVSALALYCRAH